MLTVTIKWLKNINFELFLALFLWPFLFIWAFWVKTRYFTISLVLDVLKSWCMTDNNNEKI